MLPHQPCFFGGILLQRLKLALLPLLPVLVSDAESMVRLLSATARLHRTWPSHRRLLCAHDRATHAPRRPQTALSTHAGRHRVGRCHARAARASCTSKLDLGKEQGCSVCVKRARQTRGAVWRGARCNTDGVAGRYKRVRVLGVFVGIAIQCVESV